MRHQTRRALPLAPRTFNLSSLQVAQQQNSSQDGFLPLPSSQDSTGQFGPSGGTAGEQNMGLSLQGHHLLLHSANPPISKPMTCRVRPRYWDSSGKASPQQNLLFQLLLWALFPSILSGYFYSMCFQWFISYCDKVTYNYIKSKEKHNI